LDEVLLWLCFKEFTSNLSLVKLTMKVLFLLTLATGGRISEINALCQSDSFLQFLKGGGVKLIPDPKFIAKNKGPVTQENSNSDFSPLSGGWYPSCPLPFALWMPLENICHAPVISKWALYS